MQQTSDIFGDAVGSDSNKVQTMGSAWNTNDPHVNAVRYYAFLLPEIIQKQEQSETATNARGHWWKIGWNAMLNFDSIGGVVVIDTHFHEISQNNFWVFV